MKTEPSKQEQELLTDILSFRYDPEAFVNFVFPWGQENTPLHQMEGPRQWQRDDMRRIADHLDQDRDLQRMGLPPRPFYMARASGRGPGKSAEVSMLNYWMASCWLGATGIVTANTEAQLRTRTMAELGKWHTMALNRHWFEKSAMVLRPAPWFKELVEQQLRIDTQYYYVEAQTWSEENPDAFAGAHSQIGMMLTFDEASGIPDAIWSVSEGFFTDLAPLRLWAVLSNPRRVSGKFYDCFHKDRSFWDVKTIDSRTVEGIDVAVYQRVADQYGEDHDVTRVEVKGEFPKSGEDTVIPLGLVLASVGRDVEVTKTKRVWGLDVARFGLDRTVLAKRQGNHLLEPPIQWRGKDLMQTVGKVTAMFEECPHSERPDWIVVDSIGIGAGVVDALRQNGIPVRGVNVSEAPGIGDKFMRLRDDLYWRMREWFEAMNCYMPEGCDDLIAELSLPLYEYRQNGKIKVESKQDLKKRLQRSPDLADAFMLTFAVNDLKMNYNLPEINVGMFV